MTGTRSLAQYGTATALKIDSTTWIISGAKGIETSGKIKGTKNSLQTSGQL